jgi:hypothetical protein
MDRLKKFDRAFLERCENPLDGGNRLIKAKDRRMKIRRLPKRQADRAERERLRAFPTAKGVLGITHNVLGIRHN